MKKLNKKGFTIVELVIVIAVIAILAAVLIPTFSGVVNKANDSSALQTAQNTLKQALLMTSNATLSDGSVIVLDTDKDANTRPNYVYRYGNDTLDAKTDVYADDNAVVFDSTKNVLATGTNAIFITSKAITSGTNLDSLTASIVKAATGKEVNLAVSAVSEKTNQYVLTFDDADDVKDKYTKSGDTYTQIKTSTKAVKGTDYYSDNTGTKATVKYATEWTIYTSNDMSGTNVVVFTKIG